MSRFTKFPVEATDNGFLTDDLYINSLKQQIKILVLTSSGERMYRPNYGVGLKQFIFENIANVNNKEFRYELYDRVKKQLDIYLPNISLTSVNVEQVDNRANVKLIFVIDNILTESLIVEL